MNAFSKIAYLNDYTDSARSTVTLPEATMGLGPNQLTWLRRNIDSFKHAEDQRDLAHQDTVRAARMAGLI